MTDTLVRRVGPRLRPDPAHVLAQLFVPGHALPGGAESRPSDVVEHVRSLDDHEVDAALARIIDSFGARHDDLPAILRSHADRVRNRLPTGERLSDDRWLLLGATFTQEVALQAAALCNPSMIAIDVDLGPTPATQAFVMSTRQIGEGHRSSVGFRTGTVDERGDVVVHERPTFATAGAVEPAMLDRERLRDGTEAADWALDRLPATFTTAQLDEQLRALAAQRDTRRDVGAVVEHLRDLASRSYRVTFPASSELTERVLHPASAAEANGIEDLRLVRFTEPAGTTTILGTYTAYDGVLIAQQLLTTTDFGAFTSVPLSGMAAANKGLALFPRQIDGEYVALTRFDGANNAVARSSDITRWPTATPIDHARSSWEVVQIGNCGAPIETDEGWLVITHGVGPMRTYSLGAWLLDLDDPSRLVAHLADPLLSPEPDERDGYVPNVVYSCGSLVHGDHLVIPYGIGDASIGFARASVTEVLGAMVRT